MSSSLGSPLGYHYMRQPGDAVPQQNVPLYSGPAPSYNFDNEMFSAKYLTNVEADKKDYFRGSPDMYLRNPVADRRYWNVPGNITDRSPCDASVLKTRYIFGSAIVILVLFIILMMMSR